MITGFISLRCGSISDAGELSLPSTSPPGVASVTMTSVRGNVGTGVGVFVGVGVLVGVGTFVGIAVAVGGTGVAVGLGVGVFVGLGVGVGDGPVSVIVVSCDQTGELQLVVYRPTLNK